MTEVAFQVGEVVAERYEILEEVGRGTTGVVYHARDLFVVDNDTELVALKAIHPHLHNDRQISGRVKREVEILKRLDAPNLCRLFEYVEEDGHMLISLEYVDGPTLDTYAERYGPLPVTEIAEIAQQICRALQVAHDGGVIHRDLKPSNVLIEGAPRLLEPRDEDGAPRSFLRELKVRVVDFGLSKLVATDEATTALTDHDMIFGTPDYMAPEQASGDEVDARCDLYAVGVILYELLTGEVPFPRPTAIATMSAHVNEEVAPLREAAADREIPSSLERVVARALSKSPDERFPSALAMAEALEHLEDIPASLEDAPDTLDDNESVSDTNLENAKTAIHTTLPSTEDEVAATPGRGAKVRVIVRDAPSVPPSSSGLHRSGRSSVSPVEDSEKRLWTWLTVAAALVAIGIGIWLGRG